MEFLWSPQCSRKCCESNVTGKADAHMSFKPNDEIMPSPMETGRFLLHRDFNRVFYSILLQPTEKVRTLLDCISQFSNEKSLDLMRKE